MGVSQFSTCRASESKLKWQYCMHFYWAAGTRHTSMTHESSHFSLQPRITSSYFQPTYNQQAGITLSTEINWYVSINIYDLITAGATKFCEHAAEEIIRLADSPNKQLLVIEFQSLAGERVALFRWTVYDRWITHTYRTTPQTAACKRFVGCILYFAAKLNSHKTDFSLTAPFSAHRDFYKH